MFLFKIKLKFEEDDNRTKIQTGWMCGQKGKYKDAANEFVLYSVSNTSRIFCFNLLQTCAALSHTHGQRIQADMWLLGCAQEAASNGAEPLPRPNTSLHTNTPEWQCWSEHERLKQMLTQVQVDAESLTVQQTCVHCATTTLRRLKTSTEQRKNSCHVWLCVRGRACARARLCCVHSKTHPYFRGKKKKVTVHVCVHNRARICIWERLGSVWLYNNVNVCVCWETSVCLCGVLNGGSVRRCKCGRTVCGCAASGFGSGFL